MNASYKDYVKRLLFIAVPLMLSNIINQLQMLVDRIFLGHANMLYMSVMGNVLFPIWTTLSLCFSLATGASILISQRVGAEDKKGIEEYAGSLFKYNSVIPILLFLLWCFGSQPVFRLMGVSDTLLPMCVDYARFYSPIFLLMGLGPAFMVVYQTSNHTKHLAYYAVIRSVLNIFFDWVLIFGKLGFPEMGVRGAALGTTIAEYIGGMYLVVSFLKSRKLKTRPSFASIRNAKIKSYFVSAKLGLNTALEDFFWNMGNLVLIRILNSISELAAGIYSIVVGIEVLAVVVVSALGNGTLTLTSEAVGKKDERQYKGVCLVAYILCAIVAVLMMIASLLFPEQILSIFTKDEAIITTSGVYLFFIAVNLFAKSGNIIIGNGIRGSGDTRWMFFTQIFGTVFVIALASLFVFVLNLGMAGVFLAVIADEAVRCLINMGKFFHSGRKIA